MSRTATTAKRVGKRHEWADGEVGFEYLDLQKELKRRPRDPFVIFESALVRKKSETPIELMRSARACVDAARLVPAGSIYDDFRAEFLVEAGLLARSAASYEWQADPKHRYGSQLSKEAVRICRTCLEYEADPTDWCKLDLALAVNFAGEHAGEHKEALNVATKAKKRHRDSGFAYDYACLLSLDGQTKLALDWLEFSFKQGNDDVIWARKDPELAKVRTDHPERFNRVTEVKWSWRINFGNFNDDIVLTNNSNFTLTNIAITPVITKNGQPRLPAFVFGVDAVRGVRRGSIGGGCLVVACGFGLVPC
jgi:tetratricopeptide (TPR) repeat protein